MAWTTPRTWSTAEVVTAGLMNTHVRDNLNALLHPLALSGTTTTISNSVVETSLGSFTVPGNSMGSNGELDVLYEGEYRSLRAVSDTVRIKVQFGGTTYVGALSTDTIPLCPRGLLLDWVVWRLEIKIINLGSTSSQFLSAHWTAPGPGGAGSQTSVGTWLQINDSSDQIAHARPTIDTTADRTFDVKATLSAASTNLEFKRYLFQGLAASV